MEPTVPPTPLGFVAIDPRAFDEGYSADKLLAHLTKDVLRKKMGGSRAELNQMGTAALAAKASLQNVQKLLSTLDRAEEELQLLNKEVSKKVTQLQQTVSKQESSYKEGIGEAEEARDKLRAAQRELEARMSKVSQVGTRIGDRLQSADAVRIKALELADMLSYLMRFSQLPESLLERGPGEGGAEYKSALPPVFWEDAKLRDAAGTTRRLMQLTGEAHDARARSRLVGAADDAADAAGTKGTLMYTTRQLVVYGNWLEHRVLVRFDRGLAKGSNRIMAECALIMTMYGVERNLVERYVSLLPLFAAPGPEAAIKPPTGDAPAQIAASLAPFGELCAVLLATLQEEAPRMAAVFSNARGALELLVGRSAVEKLAPALETLLLPTESDDEEEEATGPGAPGPATTQVGRGAGPHALQQGAGVHRSPQQAGGRPGGVATAAASVEDSSEEEATDDEDEEDTEEESEEGEEEDETIEGQMAGVLSRGEHQDVQGPAAARGWGKRGGKEDPHLLHMRLLLLAELFGRCRDLGRGLEAACTAAGLPGLDLRIVADGLFTTYVATYPYPELRWLALSAKAAAAALKVRTSGGALCVPLAHQMLSHSKEALDRVEVLAGRNTPLLAANVRLLFHGAGPFEPCEGCLLEMLAQHIIDGVDHSLEQCGIREPGKIAQAEVAAHFRALEAAQAAAAAAAAAAEAARGKKNAPPLPPPPPPPPPITRTVAVTRANEFVERRMSKVLEAVSGAASIMDALQEHYAAAVAPRLAAHIGELALCSGGLSMLMKAVSEAATVVLLRLVDTAIIQAEKTLMIEQKRSDFMSPPTDMSMGQPTGACMLVCAQLGALHRAASNALSPSNLNALLTEVGLRMHALLLNHMQQFTYSASGALKWKGDVGEYMSVLGAFQQPALHNKLENLRGLSNVLVVSPEGLLTLVDGALRLDHREALRYIRLRADFHTARVEGQSLEDLFGASAAVDQILMGAQS